MMIHRRTLLASLGGAAALPLLGMPNWAQAFTGQPLKQAAFDAWIFGLPLIEMAASRAQSLAHLAPGMLGHARQLTTPATQSVTTPNNDTLYSRSWINLANGPVRLTLPKTGDRYVSIALMDMYSNNFAVLGSRTTGGDGGTFTLIGPQHASSDPLAIRSPTPWVWLLSRLLIDNSADLPAAHALQDAMRVDGPDTPAPAPLTANRRSPWADYFTALQALILENPPRATDDRLFDRIAALGLTPQGGFDANRFTAAQGADIQSGIDAARTALIASGRQGPIFQQWVYPKFNLGDFGQDYFYRAQIAIGGLAALPRVEAMYMRPVDEQGSQRLDASKNYRLTFPSGQRPALDGFWSLSMYRVTADGQFFFLDNRINRYAIGDRTEGLRTETNGDLNIWLSRTDPGADRRSNWLPLPQEDQFTTVFRGYLPQADLLDGRSLLPPLVSY